MPVAMIVWLILIIGIVALGLVGFGAWRLERLIHDRSHSHEKKITPRRWTTFGIAILASSLALLAVLVPSMTYSIILILIFGDT